MYMDKIIFFCGNLILSDSHQIDFNIQMLKKLIKPSIFFFVFILCMNCMQWFSKDRDLYQL